MKKQERIIFLSLYNHAWKRHHEKISRKRRFRKGPKRGRKKWRGAKKIPKNEISPIRAEVSPPGLDLTVLIVKGRLGRGAAGRKDRRARSCVWEGAKTTPSGSLISRP